MNLFFKLVVQPLRPTWRVKGDLKAADASEWLAPKLALPDAHYPPTQCPELLCEPSITLTIPPKLFLPAIRVGSRRQVPVTLVPVPITPVNKQDHSSRAPHKIRVAKAPCVSPPA